MVGEAEAFDGGGCLALDVPPVADHLEIANLPLPRCDAIQSLQDRGYAENVSHRTVALQHQLLRQIADPGRSLHRTRARQQLASQYPQQGRLAATVTADQAGGAVGEGGIETGEHGLAVGPGERQMMTNEGRHRSAPGVE